jgi:hypothetical protein
MTQNATHPLRLAVAAAAVGLALSACTGTGGTPTAAPATTTAAAPTASSSGGGGAAPSTSAAAPATSATSAAPKTAAGPSACTGTQVAVSAGQSDGAAGHIGARVVFTNTSAATCTLYGFPGVAGLDANGKQQVQAKRVTSGYLGTAKATTVLLAPGATASALVGGVDVPSGNATSCPTYPKLLVTPPGTRASSTVALSMPGCPTLVVYPVVAGVPAP